MKIRLYILVLGLLAFSSCGKDQIGFLEASTGRYVPEVMEVRNCPLFYEEQGWYGGIWSHEEELDRETFERYTEDWIDNFSHYVDSLPYLGKPMQAIIGTAPMRVTLRDVVSRDGGDVKLFKEKVSVWGDGTVEVPTAMITSGTYILHMEVSNQGNRVQLDSAFIVRIFGKIPDKPIHY